MDTGLHSLVAIARFHQLPAEIDQLTHQLGEPGKRFTETELLQAAKALTLKAKRLTPSFSKLHNSMLPAIVKSSDGSYFILARISTDKMEANPSGDQQGTVQTVLIHDLRDDAPRSITVDEFKQLWSGELIALTRRQVSVRKLAAII